MSQRAILLAVCDRLCAPLPEGGGFALGTELDIQYDGEPPPGAPAQFFVAVHDDGGQAGPLCNVALDEIFSVAVTVTVKVSRIPQGKQAFYSILRGEDGKNLIKLSRRVITALNAKYEVTGAANDIIVAEEEGTLEDNSFRSHIVLTDPGRITPRGPEWFNVAPVEGQRPPLGVSLTMKFGQARRIQYLATMQ